MCNRDENEPRKLRTQKQIKMHIERLKINKYCRPSKILTLLLQKGWGSIVNIATRLQAGRSEIQIPTGVSDFSLLFNVQTGSDVLHFSYSIVTGAVSWDYSCWGHKV